MRMMRNVRFDTRAELKIRSELHRRGLRFRVHTPLAIGGSVVRPDVVFRRRRVAVFVDGCFWHSCPVHGNRPIHNNTYWDAKFERNSRRDRRVNECLSELGWRVVRIWEHVEPEEAVSEILSTLITRPSPEGGHA